MRQSTTSPAVSRPHATAAGRLGRLMGAAMAMAVVAVSLTGCATGAGASGCVAAGTQSNQVIASGAFGHAPTVTFPTPLHVSNVQATTLIEGSGDQVAADQEIVADLTVFDATTGKKVEATKYDGTVGGAATFVPAKAGITGLGAGLVCSRVGERVAITTPATKGYPSASRPAAVGKADSLVVVADVRKAYLARANGVNQVMAGGLPSVVLAPNGQPGITVPKTDPPKSLEVANLKVGDGAVIHAGDTAIIHYTAVLWSDQTVVESSWTDGTPASIVVKKGEVIQGLVTALTGQRVGSQVLAVLPPGEAYGSAGSGSVPANATLVFVIDVLGKA